MVILKNKESRNFQDHSHWTSLSHTQKTGASSYPVADPVVEGQFPNHPYFSYPTRKFPTILEN